MAGKLGNGEGTIRKRSDGRWEVRIVLEGGVRKSLYAKTRQEASRLLAQARRDREDGVSAFTDRQTVEQYLTTWLEGTKASTTEVSSYVRIQFDVRRCLIPRLGSYQLRKLTGQQVQAFYGQMLGEGYAASTVKHMHTTLHDALQTAVKLGLVHRNVADLVDPPRVLQREMDVLTEQQVRTLLDTVKGDRLEAVIVLALATGLRAGELMALQWHDVNLDSGVLQVRRTLKRVSRGYGFGRAKTKRSHRPIALPTMATEALQKHHAAQLEERAQAKDAWQDLDLVFCNEIGQRISRHTFQGYSWFGRVLRAAGLPHVRFHDLRHTAATLLLARGVNVKVVSEMLGHSSISVTLSLYAHVLPHMQRDAAATMDDLLRG